MGRAEYRTARKANINIERSISNALVDGVIGNTAVFGTVILGSSPSRPVSLALQSVTAAGSEVKALQYVT